MEQRAKHTSPLAGSTVLVTGGTGFTGSNLVRKLVDMESVKVRGIARPSSEIGEDLAEAVTWYRGDVYDAEVVEDAMDGVHYVFHLAACFRDPAADDDEYRKVHVESTKLLAEAALNSLISSDLSIHRRSGCTGMSKIPPPMRPLRIIRVTSTRRRSWKVSSGFGTLRIKRGSPSWSFDPRPSWGLATGAC